MNFPFELVFRHSSRSRDVERLVREETTRLTRVCNRILFCRVVIDVPHRRHQHGNRYRVRITLTVPGFELVGGNDPGGGSHDNEDVQAAVRDAFHAVRRQISAHDRHRRELHRRRRRESTSYHRVNRAPSSLGQ